MRSLFYSLLLLLPLVGFADTREKCLAILREGLRSEEFWPSIHAAEGLTLAGHETEVAMFLEPRLQSESDDQKRCGIARELVRAGKVEKSEVMLSILQGEDPHGIIHAAESLYKVGWTGSEEPLRVSFQESTDIRLQLMAAAALAKHTTGQSKTDSLVFLRTVLRENPDPAIYRLAGWVLARVGEKSDVPSLQDRVSETEDESAKTTLEHSLACLGDPNGRSAVVRNLRSPDPVIRAQAATFAGEIELRESIPSLLELLDDEALDPRIRAAQSLLQLLN